jgi:hypothetical protein
MVYKGHGWIDMHWINLVEIRSLWQADVSMEMKFLISKLCHVVNVAFCLLGDSPMSEGVCRRGLQVLRKIRKPLLHSLKERR